jgi:hypothetical protein
MTFSKRYTLFTAIIVIIYLGVILWAWLSRDLKLPLFITILAAVSTIYFTVVKYQLDADNMFKSLFETFNNRFDELNRALNAIKENRFTNDLDREKRDANAVIQDYLNLCAEEWYWRKKGRIPKDIWESWKEGIRYYTNCPSIDEYFKQERTQDKAYYGFFTEFYDAYYR